MCIELRGIARARLRDCHARGANDHHGRNRHDRHDEWTYARRLTNVCVHARSVLYKPFIYSLLGAANAWGPAGTQPLFTNDAGNAVNLIGAAGDIDLREPCVERRIPAATESEGYRNRFHSVCHSSAPQPKRELPGIQASYQHDQESIYIRQGLEGSCYSTFTFPGGVENEGSA